jgi:hypothetical protein
MKNATPAQKGSAEFKAAEEIIANLDTRIQTLTNHADFIAKQGKLDPNKKATEGIGLLGVKIQPLMTKMQDAAKFSKKASDTQLDVFSEMLPKDELAEKRKQLMDGIAEGTMEVEKARKATEVFFKKGSTAVNKVMDHCMEELGISYGLLFVLLIAISLVLASTFLFVFAAANAFLGPEGSAAIQSVLVGLAGAVSSVFSKSNAEKSKEDATGSAMERVTEIIESQVKAVVGKMGAINDDSLQEAISSAGQAASGAVKGAADEVAIRVGSGVPTMSASGQGAGGTGNGGLDSAEIMASLLKTVKRNNPEKFKGIKQVCKTEDEEKQEVNVVQVFQADMQNITDPAFALMQKDIKSIKDKLDSLGPAEQTLQFKRNYDLFA